MSLSEPQPQTSLNRSLKAHSRARTHEIWLRAAVLAWSALILLWLAPVGPWSGTRHHSNTTLLLGGLLGFCGMLLALVYRQVSRVRAMHAATIVAKRQLAQGRSAPRAPKGWSVESQPNDQIALLQAMHQRVTHVDNVRGVATGLERLRRQKANTATEYWRAALPRPQSGQ